MYKDRKKSETRFMRLKDFQGFSILPIQKILFQIFSYLCNKNTPNELRKHNQMHLSEYTLPKSRKMLCLRGKTPSNRQFDLLLVSK